MARNAEYDPVVVDSQLSVERLIELLNRSAESAKLDYKEAYDPSDKSARVRLAKHVLAMANTAGGYIVLGVRDDGIKVGLPDSTLAQLDEATIRQQASAFSSVPIPLFFANRLVHEGKAYALLVVLPLTDRIAVALADGQFLGKNGRTESLFRAGDILVRHGSSSERWNQEDADWIVDRILRIRKDRWLQDFSGDFRRLVELAAPAGPAPIDERALKQGPADFAKMIHQLLRASDG